MCSQVPNRGARKRFYDGSIRPQRDAGCGTEMLHVPYRGGAPAIQDLLGDRFTGYFAAPPTALPQLEAGKL